MNTTLTRLEPAELWQQFERLNAIPRPSKNEEAAARMVRELASEHGLEASTDAAGNVLVRKPGRAGRPVVALQSHLDMVHQKNAGTEFDFERQGIRMRVEGDWVKAEGTTLGADNGIGVAAMLALMVARSDAYGPLEFLFTVDEETGLTGAAGLEPGWLTARYLLNLDTEDDRELTIGCAGGVDLVASGTYPTVPVPPGHKLYQVELSGLSGGHSGMDIHRGLGNANKLMNRFLHATRARLASLDGGGLRNAIPRESRAVVAVPDGAELERKAAELDAILREEHRHTDPELSLRVAPGGSADSLVHPDFQERLLRVIYAVPHGIHRMSPSVPGLVQTSNNLARVLVEKGEFSVQTLCRGSVESEKQDHADGIQAVLELLGGEARQVGGYPGWTPRPDNHLVQTMSALYRELFAEEPVVNACHAGLECGILGRHYPDMQMISFGPTILGAHSPDERVQVSSVQKFWRFLTTALERL